MLQQLVVKSPLYYTPDYMSSGRLREVKKKRTLQTFSSTVVVVA